MQPELDKEYAPGTGVPVFSALGLSLLGTTCCALPIALVAVGAGSAVASLVSAAPWLMPLAEYKAVTFSATALLLGYSGWRLSKVTHCDIADRRRLRLQRGALWFSTALLVVSVFAAYAALPIRIWLDS
jgi:hypothetical protein